MPAYKISKVIDSDQVPGWIRRSKYDDIVEAVLELKEGKALTVVFDDKDDAVRAKNSIRDRLNKKRPTVSTRSKKTADQEWTVYLSKLTVEEIEKIENS